MTFSHTQHDIVLLAACILRHSPSRAILLMSLLNKKYLGCYLHFNGNFNYSIVELEKSATKAMFALLSNYVANSLDVDTVFKLFDACVAPIFMYACEVWGFTSLDVIERLHVKFIKYILKLNKSTPAAMVYGDTGRYPCYIDINVRMVSFWHKLLTGANCGVKFSSRLCGLLMVWDKKMCIAADG